MPTLFFPTKSLLAPTRWLVPGVRPDEARTIEIGRYLGKRSDEHTVRLQKPEWEQMTELWPTVL